MSRIDETMRKKEKEKKRDSETVEEEKNTFKPIQYNRTKPHRTHEYFAVDRPTWEAPQQWMALCTHCAK